MFVEEWLQRIHLQQYIPVLVEAGYESTSHCASLTDAVLHDIGVTLLGHRKRILAYLPKVELMETEQAASKAEMSDEATDEAIYDVPWSYAHDVVHQTLEDDEVFNPCPEGALVPPLLPPKKKQIHKSIDERLGMVTHVADANPHRPVPVPRKSIIPKKPVPRPRKKCKSQNRAESLDPVEEQKPESKFTQSDSDVTGSDTVVTQSDSVVTQSDTVVTQTDSVVTQSDTVVTQSDNTVTLSDSVVTRTDDHTQDGVVDQGISDGVGAEGHLAAILEQGEQINNNKEPRSESKSAIYDDVYIEPDDIVIGCDGEISVTRNSRETRDSDDDDGCCGDYIAMDDVLDNGDTYPGPLEDRVVIGAESPVDKRGTCSQSSEEIYGQMWVMSSGKTASTVESCHSSFLPQTRNTVVSFCAPPPSYDPPPLPEGVAPCWMAPLQTPDGPPPTVPPRPAGYKVPPLTGSVAGLRPESIEFSQFVAERIESERQAEVNSASSSQGSDCDTSPTQPRQTALPCGQADARPKPPPRVPNPFQMMYNPISRSYSFDNEPDSAEASWDSDDNLSDGGDFFEDDFQLSPLDHLKASIPFVPAVQNNIKERQGYLYKCASKRSKARGLIKRWVTFNGRYLKYFSSDKSVISKRMIPLTSIFNITNGVKAGEPHPFHFQVITVDRIYTFATDDIDNLSLWANILMRAVIENKFQLPFPEGGEMCQPKNEGFVKIHGARGKRYLAVKSDQFAYYNTYNDFKAGCPIHVIDMKLASMKEISKMKLQLTTPYAAYIMSFETSEELGQWKDAFEEATCEGLADDTVLAEVYKNHSNRLCADCGQQDPHWASINIGITMCKHCAGIHRGLGVGLSKVRSLRMDMKVWTPSLIQMMTSIGNDEANNFWEWNSSEEDRIDPTVDVSVRCQYIRDKYRNKLFCRFHPLRTNQQSLNEALCKSAQFGDIIETMHLLFSGANVLHRSEIFNNETPLMLARKTKQMLQVELLSLNGGDRTQQDVPVVTAGLPQVSAVPCQKGHLYKTGSNQKGDFQRRWCYLDQGTLAYYENEKTNIAKDAINKQEVLSINTTTDSRFEFAFELNTTKHGSRVYLFAAETEQDRDKWVINIAKNFANVPETALRKIQTLDRGGVVFVQEGATNNWCKSWMHMKGKTLHFYNTEKEVFEEIDLRKVTNIMVLQSTRRCIDTYDDGQPFVIDLPNRALYMQGDTRRETEDWFTALHTAATKSGPGLYDQQLTVDDTPVILDKCINFVAMHGMMTEGIYRHSGQHSMVTQLLKLFGSDARSVHLRLEEYSIHDVCNVMKRFLRFLDDSVLTHALYAKWLEASGIEAVNARLQWYKYLLGELPRVNYMTLKKLMTHLCRIAEQQHENKMSIINIASIFGPVLMMKKEEGDTVSGYGGTYAQISAIRDLLENYKWLFEVKENELERERKIEEAIRQMEQLKSATKKSGSSDLLLGIYLHSMDGQVVMLKVPPAMTAEEVLKFVVKKAELDTGSHWGIFEVICGSDLQRPLHYSEKVLDVTLCWSSWPDEFCRDNYLCVKENTIYEKIELVYDQAHGSLYGELRFSERKGFKKYHFEFSQYKLMYHKDSKGTSPLGSWNVEDLTVYIGVQGKRSPPTQWGFTFIVTKEPVSRGKDYTFFGYSACCDNEEELYRWIAAILHAQHSGGLEFTSTVAEASGGFQNRSNSPCILNLPVPLDAGFSSTPKTHRQSLFSKFRKK